jgi:sodium-dependent dicarboxylate transporter 2/3/5
VGLAAGPLVALMLYALLPDAEGLSEAGRRTLAVAAWMALWWITEALPIEATALLPLAVFPVLGIADIEGAAAPYADPVIFLFLGGVMLGAAMERWGLHRRLALLTMLAVGTRPAELVGGIMLATASISMWVSNTATAVMMLPIGLSLVQFAGGQGKADGNFGKCMMLGIAYAATIGGIGTVIGTPPNAVAMGFIERSYGVQIGFLEWLEIGLPVMLVFLPLAWLCLVRLVFPCPGAPIAGARALIQEELVALGPLSRGEALTGLVFVLAALAWVLRQPLADVLGLVHRPPGAPPEYLLSDAGIAIIAALLLFAIPVDARSRTFIIEWRDAARLPWGVLILLGGGLTLAAAFGANGVDRYIGAGFGGLAGLPVLAVVGIVSAIVVFTTEFGSNTAVVNIFLPIVAAAAVDLGIHPYLLIFPTALAASYAFMMPMGTPPNALAFASGHLHVPDMAKAGFLLNLLSILVITLFIYYAAPVLLGFEIMGGVPVNRP